MTKWDYLVVEVVDKQPPEIQTILRQAGGQGWELVATVNGLLFYFKRPIP